LGVASNLQEIIPDLVRLADSRVVHREIPALSQAIIPFRGRRFFFATHRDFLEISDTLATAILSSARPRRSIGKQLLCRRKVGYKKSHDGRAIHLLIDLRDLAIREGHETEFRAELEDLRVKHATKRSFIERLLKANI
jgi:hypothetical protein